MFKNASGFTIVEVLISIAVIGVLVALAVPTYRQYSVRESRAEVQSVMVQIAQKLAAYKMANNDYNTTLTNGAVYGSTNYPVTGTATYTLSLTSNTNSWTLTATAVGKQAGNGNLVLNDQGWKCWNNPDNNTTNACVANAPTATTTWNKP